MLRAVPKGKSFFGCGTTMVIVPFLNLWCDPLTLTNSNRSALRRLTMSRQLRNMRNYIHTTTSEATHTIPERIEGRSLDRVGTSCHRVNHATSLLLQPQEGLGVIADNDTISCGGRLTCSSAEPQ